MGVAKAQIALGRGVILPGGFAKPIGPLQLILQQAMSAKAKGATQFALGLSVAPFRPGADIRQRLGPWLGWQDK
jgi:hypothetical protein